MSLVHFAISRVAFHSTKSVDCGIAEYESLSREAEDVIRIVSARQAPQAESKHYRRR